MDVSNARRLHDLEAENKKAQTNRRRTGARLADDESGDSKRLDEVGKLRFYVARSMRHIAIDLGGKESQICIRDGGTHRKERRRPT